MEQFLRVGVISSTHGIKGEVKVFPTTDDVNRYKDLKEVFLDTGKGRILMELEQVKFHKNMVIVKFKGYDNINDVIDGNDGKEYLFPSIKECILDVNLEEGKVTVHILDGLLDL